MWSSVFKRSTKKTESSIYGDKVKFKINEVAFEIGSEAVATDTTLNSYIRDAAHLKGTKFMCLEGGCGSCMVAATVEHPVTKVRETFAVNSCLVPVLACDGWEVTTVEGIGNSRSGYHKVQATLAHFNGTQCGYCSSGMVMSMYGLLEGGNVPTNVATVENAFGGNLCRCTGYRSILDAFKSLCTDAEPKLKQHSLDIEDLYKICKKSGGPCQGTCGDDFIELSLPPDPVRIEYGNYVWYKVRSIAEIFEIFSTITTEDYKLVAGNTSEGVHKSQATVYIDVKDVTELRTFSTAPTLSLGANVTLNEAAKIFITTSAQPGYWYLKQLATHIDKIAHVAVRNIGTLAGNLCLKKSHPDFPSDVFTILETVGALLEIIDSGGNVLEISLVDFLSFDMRKKVLQSIKLPALNTKYEFTTFKIMPRAQNSLAYVNAGFLLTANKLKNWEVLEKPRIVFGGISSTFVHATQVEDFLINKPLLNPEIVSGALSTLQQELSAEPGISQYHKELAIALFYKFLLRLNPKKVSPARRSGGNSIERTLSSGIQEYDTDISKYPINKPIQKIEAFAQTSGEAEYVNDLPLEPRELHAAFVLTQQALGHIVNIDSTAATVDPGFVAFYKYSDIPGSNILTPSDFGGSRYPDAEEIFCSGDVKYAGQAVGVVIAETRVAALRAAAKVVVQYSNAKKPVVSLVNVQTIAASRKIDVSQLKLEDGKSLGGTETGHSMAGEFELGKQYHFTMETQTCRVAPSEGGVLNVFVSTQWMDLVQAVVARTVAIPSSLVNVVVRRLGGAYGGKITRPPQLAAACALAVTKLGRPVRMVLTLKDNMELAGKRFGLRNHYQVETDDEGKILKLNATIYEDSGCNRNDSSLQQCIQAFNAGYDSTNFNVIGQQVETDTASNTWCRGPGTTDGTAFIEEIMERIADTLNLDPLSVRLTNLSQENNILSQMIADLKIKADYENRRQAVDAFNASGGLLRSFGLDFCLP